MAWIARQLNAGVLDQFLQGLSKGFWGTLQLRAGCGTDRIKKEGRKLPCEPEAQPGLLPLACWVGNKWCQTSEDEHKSRVFLEEHMDSAVISCSQSRRCRHCPNRLHPMGWHKNNHWGGQWSISLFKASLHPMSSMMVKGAYLYRIPLRLWYDTVQVTSCIEHLTFLDRFGLFFPQNHFLSYCKPLLSTSSHDKNFHSWMKNHLFFFKAVFNFPICFILSCSWVERLWIIILFSSSAD